MKILLSPPGFESVLREELGDKILKQVDDLFWADVDQAAWAQNVWLEPRECKFKSINEAAKILRGIQRNWWLHSTNCHRRAQLIKDQLPPMRSKPIAFGTPLPKAPLGSWTLLDEQTLLYSAKCSSALPDGQIQFVEDKSGPPSRAYLKLWELFTVLGVSPQPGDQVIDLGSSPGGWTWVLDQLGCLVHSVDKAPLAESVKWSSRVKYEDASAFGLAPRPIDWLFSDVICYPTRLLTLVKAWLPHARNMVCTIKFQGPTDHAIVREFLAIEGSDVRHLSVNKHELTWFRLAKT